VIADTLLSMVSHSQSKLNVCLSFATVWYIREASLPWRLDTRVLVL